MSNSIPGRLNYSGDLKPVILRVAEDYKLGKVTQYKPIKVGYEDCNVLIETDTQRFLAKIFASSRTPEEVQRYASIIRTVVDNGVNHPNLKVSSQGDIYRDETGLSLVLLDFVEGKTFLEMDRAPVESELEVVVKQAALINKVDLKLPPLFDSWSVQNLEGIYEKIRQFLEPSDLKLAEEAKERFLSVPIDTLPHAFVHGDITKANTILSDKNEIYIIDFAVTNWYPRIQELAVIAANLLYDQTKPEKPQELAPNLVKIYRQYGELTEAEEKHLPNYILGAIAMEFLGGSKVKYLDGHDSEETQYWIELGRKNLQKALNYESS